MASLDERKKTDSKVTLRGLLQAAKSSGVCVGQKIVLVLCLDESTKTTTVNALSGMQTEETPEIIALGTRCRDPTREGSVIVFVKTPSLRDIQSDVDAVIAMGSIEMCIRWADEVTFLVVIPYEDIGEKSAPKFRALMEDLILLFKSPAAMARHAVFVIHCSGSAEEAAGFLARRLPELRKEFMEKAKEMTLYGKYACLAHLREVYAKMAAFVGVMCENIDKTVFFDRRDEGRSARKVFELVNKITPLSRHDGKIADIFNFTSSWEFRKAVNEGVLSGVSDGMSNMQWAQECANRCAEIRGQMRRCEAHIAASQELVDDLRRQQRELQRKLAEAEGNLATHKVEVGDRRMEFEKYSTFGLQAMERLGQLQPGLEVLAEISEFLDVPKKVVKNFSAGYREFKQQEPELRDCLEAACDRTDPEYPALEDREPDPIITDPVCTESETVSRAASLVQESDRTPSETLPIVHVRGDGPRETVPHTSSKRARRPERHPEESTRRRREDATRLDELASASVENGRARELAKQMEELTLEIKQVLEAQASRYLP